MNGHKKFGPIDVGFVRVLGFDAETINTVTIRTVKSTKSTRKWIQTLAMTPILDIKCPKCALPLRLQRPTGPSEITCPKCGNQIGLTAAGTITAARRQDDFAELPAPVVASFVPARPKNVRPTPTVAPRPLAKPRPVGGQFQPSLRPAVQKKDPERFKNLVVPSICVLVTIVLGIGLYSLRDSAAVNRHFPIDSIIASLPMMDSHENVLQDFVELAESASQVFMTLRGSAASPDQASIQKAVESLETLNAQLRFDPPPRGRTARSHATTMDEIGSIDESRSRRKEKPDVYIGDFNGNATANVVVGGVAGGGTQVDGKNEGC